MGTARASVGGVLVHGSGPALWRVAGGQILASYDFTGQSLGALTLPGALQFARTGAALVADHSAGIVSSSAVSANNARSGKSATGRTGMRFEEPKTNAYGYANTPSLASSTAGSSGSTFTTGRTGPDGGTTATRIQQNSGTFSRYQGITTAGALTTYCLSAWVKAGLGSGVYLICAPYAGTLGAAVTGTAGASWARATGFYAYPSTSASNLVGADGRANAPTGASAGARDFDVAFIQFEIGQPSDPILTSGGSTATRNGERLYLADCAGLVLGGRLALEIVLEMPSSISGPTVASQSLFYFDANNRAEIATGTGVVTVTINGSTFTSSSNDTWTSGQLHKVWIECGGNGLQTVVKSQNDGGATRTIGTSSSPQAALPTSGALDLLCAGATNQLAGLVQSITFHAPGGRPAWVA